MVTRFPAGPVAEANPREVCGHCCGGVVLKGGGLSREEDYWVHDLTGLPFCGLDLGTRAAPEREVGRNCECEW